MNITKTIAEKVASFMIEPIRLKIENINKAILEIAQKAVTDSIPKDLGECYKKYTSCFQKSSKVTLVSGSHEVRICDLQFFPSYTSYYPIVEVQNEVLEKINNLLVQKKELEKEAEKTENSIIFTLLSLKTFKRVEDSFPDAYKYLKEYDKKQKKTELALPIENILNVINKYN